DNREEILNKTREEVLSLLKKSIKPEFLNRIDEIIMFQPLTQKEINKIVEKQIGNIQKMLEKNGIHMTTTKKAIEHIAKIGFDPQFGARPIKRVIQKEIINELSKMILSDKIDKTTTITVDEKDQQLVFSNN
ncbi:MAG: type VI secretion system ATPase TssH, partial [Candidatus Bathyarchaeota archaeon]|nr:type VI secretion system ATPase TssH [Candidatus Termiticorpusculum sp.]